MGTGALCPSPALIGLAGAAGTVTPLKGVGGTILGADVGS